MCHASDLIVLICESYQQPRNNLCDQISSLGMERLLCAESREQAIDTINKHHVDIVLMSPSLNNSDGFELGKELKRSRPGLILIYSADFITARQQIQALAAGANGFIKRDSPGELQNTVSYWADMISQRKTAQEILERKF